MWFLVHGTCTDSGSFKKRDDVTVEVCPSSFVSITEMQPSLAGPGANEVHGRVIRVDMCYTRRRPCHRVEESVGIEHLKADVSYAPLCLIEARRGEAR